MPAPATTPELLELVRKSGLVGTDRLDEITVTPLPPNPTQAAGFLVTRRLLTEFQAKLLLVGRYKGFRLGPYVLCELLGRGGMGTVYKAEHELLRRTVAVKVLSDHKDQLTRERFHREARAAAALDHLNIVRTHDVGRDGNTHYIVMEYVEGQTLDQIVEANGPMTVPEAVDAIGQAAAGLQHAHDRGFLHRDIKPANLIRTADGTVKILDMGLARSMDKKDELTEYLDKGAIVGTADYISPEQVMNDPNIDIRSDLYSLGATLFAILAGRPLFAGTTVSKLAQHQMKAPALNELQGRVPAGLLAVLAKMLAKRPDDRFQTPAELMAALQPWRGDTADAQPTFRKTRLRWPIWVGVGVAAIAIGTALAFLFAQPKAAEPVVEVKNPPVLPPVSPPPPPEIPPPVFRLNTAKLKPFEHWKSHGEPGLPPSETGLPRGVGYLSYRKGSAGAFAGEQRDGKMVFAVANTTSELSSQFYFALEKEMGVKLESGRSYTLTVEYATDDGVKAGVDIQNEKFDTLMHLPLAATKGEWRTQTKRFTRPTATPLRVTFGNQSFQSADKPGWARLRRLEIVAVE